MTDDAAEQALVEQILAYYGDGTTLEWDEASPTDLRVLGPDGDRQQETMGMPSRLASLREIVSRFTGGVGGSGS